MIEVGDTYSPTLTVKDADGLPKQPASATYTVTLPGTGGTASGSVDLGTTCTATYVPTVAGLHKGRWVTVDPGKTVTDYFNVREFISVLSLAEAKDHLNIKKALADGGAELRRFLMGSTEMIESKVGILVAREFTERITEDNPDAIILCNKPVIQVDTITSAWPGGPSWTTEQLWVDQEAGVVYPAQWAGWPTFWWPPWDVVYTCGRAVIPERFIHAAKEQLRHLWETQRGSQPPQVLAGEEVYTATAGWSFSVPRRVLELLEADMVPSS